MQPPSSFNDPRLPPEYQATRQADSSLCIIEDALRDFVPNFRGYALVGFLSLFGAIPLLALCLYFRREYPTISENLFIVERWLGFRYRAAHITNGTLILAEQEGDDGGKNWALDILESKRFRRRFCARAGTYADWPQELLG